MTALPGVAYQPRSIDDPGHTHTAHHEGGAPTSGGAGGAKESSSASSAASGGGGGGGSDDGGGGGRTAWEVYCDGPLLAAVQSARLFSDCKTFVDMPMKQARFGR